MKVGLRSNSLIRLSTSTPGCKVTMCEVGLFVTVSADDDCSKNKRARTQPNSEPNWVLILIVSRRELASEAIETRGLVRRGIGHGCHHLAAGAGGRGQIVPLVR